MFRKKCLVGDGCLFAALNKEYDCPCNQKKKRKRRKKNEKRRQRNNPLE